MNREGVKERRKMGVGWKGRSAGSRQKDSHVVLYSWTRTPKTRRCAARDCELRRRLLLARLSLRTLGGAPGKDLRFSWGPARSPSSPRTRHARPFSPGANFGYREMKLLTFFLRVAVGRAPLDNFDAVGLFLHDWACRWGLKEATASGLLA